jgi:Zn-dependent alcohol dehydrogenase
MGDVVVILQHDAKLAIQIANSLRERFRRPVIAENLVLFREAVMRSRADAAVIDLGSVGVETVQNLHSTLNLRIVCTHRIPDEHMWALCIQAGALDCCYEDDVFSVCRAFSEQGAAAAA